MTLIEMVVILAIMGALATLVITGLESVADRGRQDETIRRGERIYDCIVAPDDGPSRFLRDMGRIPRVISLGEGKILCELWDGASVNAAVLWNGGAAFSNAGGQAWPDVGAAWTSLPASVTMPCGWRGPYLGLNTEEFYDGWGAVWQINTGGWAAALWEDRTSAALDDAIYGIRSLGRDKLAGGTSWDEEEQEFAFSESLVNASLTVELLRKVGAADLPINAAFMDNLRVALFMPYVRRSALAVKRVLASRDGGGALALQILPAADAGYAHPESATWEAHNRVRFEGLAPGPRRIYAYGFKSGGTPNNQYGSYVMLVNLQPGDNSRSVYLFEDL